MNNKFDTQDLIDAINQIKSASNYINVVAYGGCELPIHIKEIFELYNVEYKKLPNYLGLDVDKDVIYIFPQHILDI